MESMAKQAVTTNETWLNLLYEFTDITTGRRKRFGSKVIGETEEEKRANLLYLVRFVYLYGYGLKTFEEAICHPEISIKTPLAMLIKCNYFYLLSDKGIEPIRSIATMLEIVYRQLDVDKDLLECYQVAIKHAKPKRAEELKEIYGRIVKLIGQT